MCCNCAGQIYIYEDYLRLLFLSVDKCYLNVAWWTISVLIQNKSVMFDEITKLTYNIYRTKYCTLHQRKWLLISNQVSLCSLIVFSALSYYYYFFLWLSVFIYSINFFCKHSTYNCLYITTLIIQFF